MKTYTNGYDYLNSYYPHLLAKFRSLSCSGIFVATFGGPEFALRYAVTTPETLQGVIDRSDEFLYFYTTRAKIQIDTYTKEQLDEFIKAWEVFVQFLVEEVKPVLEKMPKVAEVELIEGDVDTKWLRFMTDKMSNGE